ncbi:MAG: membrane integrity-associated transporter subunit PqiC [Alphaproteobacteria bacterium]|nr:membrane integrity-associated transporter subunit PqiC [Alphaproteobacteria bacterium]
MKATPSLLLSRRLLLAGAGGFALASCGDLIGPPQAPKLYVLKPALPPAAPGAKIKWALSIALPNASAGLDTDRIAILRPPSGMDYYADAAWPDRLPGLVQDALLLAFEESRRIGAVARDSEAAHSDYILSLDLRDFEARYDQPDGVPVAVVRIGATLIAARKRDIAGHLDAAEEAPASRNSVAAAVAALDEALARALAKIVDWTLAVPKP